MKDVLLIGATGGFGFPIARLLSAQGGWRVFAAGTNPQMLEQLGKLPNTIPVNMDIRDRASVEAGLETVCQQTDSLYALLHFAGVSSFVAMSEGDPMSEIERHLDINLRGVALVNTVFLPLIRQGNGRILHCTSEAGWMTSQPFAGPYFMTKHAVEAYNDSLRRELMFCDIPVIKLQPGTYRTSLTDSIRAGFKRAAAETRYYQRPLSKLGSLVEKTLDTKHNIDHLARLVLRILESKKPRIRYRIDTSRNLLLLELFPDSWVDWIYKAIAK